MLRWASVLTASRGGPMRCRQIVMFRPAISVATFLMLSEVCFAATFQPIVEVPTGLAQTPEAISADGSTVVGSCCSIGQVEAFVWTEELGLIGLGDLSGSGIYSQAQGVSADGSVVVGVSTSASHPSQNEAFIWTSAGGMVGLGDIPGSYFNSGARGVSADGSVVVGLGYSSNGPEAFRWSAADGMVGLDDFRGGGHYSEAYASSADGNVIVGAGRQIAGIEAFRWTAAEGLVGLGFLSDWPIHENVSVAEAVSADGSVIVGSGINADGEHRPFRWTATEGMVDSATLRYRPGPSAFPLTATSSAYRRKLTACMLRIYGRKQKACEACVKYLLSRVQMLMAGD